MRRQMESHRVTIGDVTFAIYKFSAWDASEVSGDLAHFIGPMVSGLAPLVQDYVGSDDDGDGAIGKFLKMDINAIVPSLATIFQYVEGSKVRGMMEKLLIAHRNVSFEYRDEGGQVKQEWLNKESADIAFEGPEDMYRLAVEVIKLNFKDFFPKLLGQFGLGTGAVSTSTQGSTASSMRPNLTILS